MQQSPPLITRIEAFLSRHDMKAVSFGRQAMNDPHFVRDIRQGRDLKLSTLERLQAFMAERDAELAADMAVSPHVPEGTPVDADASSGSPSNLSARNEAEAA